jgi:predicted ribosome quality control (RQC) complex YloA/Tae2 family protein
LQPVDYTTLLAICAELRQQVLPARVEQVCQLERQTIHVALRTLQGRRWLAISWHPQAARLGITPPPPKGPDLFSFSQQLWHQLGGLALVGIQLVTPWERVVDLEFAQRPGDPVLWHLYVEVMGQYSNVILVNAEGAIVTAAYQIGERQSRLRSVQTSSIYERPPKITSNTPSLEESYENWRENIKLIPGTVAKNLLSLYRGLSTALVRSLLVAAHLSLDVHSDDLNEADWQRLFDCWQFWLRSVAAAQFQPNWTSWDIEHDANVGYSVIAWPGSTAVASVQDLIQQYYGDRTQAQAFQQLRHQLQQRLQQLLGKLYQKSQDFTQRLDAADGAETLRQQADLLMAHLHLWQPGLTQIDLPDFETQQPVRLSLSPEKNAVQNAQALYKRHQKLKRSRAAIVLLQTAVQAEIDYLEQVATAIAQLDAYREAADLIALQEIREELVQAEYLRAAIASSHKTNSSKPNSKTKDSATPPHQFSSPSGYAILVGRNNRQNDQLTFSQATDYDLWFHTQQIPGSHVLLRLPPGESADPADLQAAADLSAYFSQARESDQAPIVYTQPKHVYKPKGAKLGMVIYKQETILWGYPQQAKAQFVDAVNIRKP